MNLFSRVFFVLSLILVLIGLALSAYLLSERGLRDLVAWGGTRFGIDIESVSGSLATQSCIGSLHYATEDFDLSVTDLCIDVNWLHVLRYSRIRLSSVRLTTLKVVTPAKSPNPSVLLPAVTIPWLPIDVNIEFLAAAEIQIDDQVLTDVQVKHFEATKSLWKYELLQLRSDNRIFVNELSLVKKSGSSPVVRGDITVTGDLEVTLTLAGRLDQLEFEAVAYGWKTTGVINLTSSNWPFRSRVTSPEISLEPYGLRQAASLSSSVKGDVTGIDVQGELRSAGSVAGFNVQLQGESLQARLVFKSFPLAHELRTVPLTGNVEIRTDRSFKLVELRIDELVNLFSRQALTGSATIGLDLPSITVVRSSFTAGAGTLSASGFWRGAGDWNLETETESFPLSLPGLSAGLSGKAALGSGQARGSFDVKDLEYQGFSVPSVNLQLDLAALDWLVLIASGISRDNNAIGELKLRLHGEPFEGAFDLDAVRAGHGASSSGKYRFENEILDLNIATLVASYHFLAGEDLAVFGVESDPKSMIKLVQPLSIRSNGSELSIGPIVLANDSGGHAQLDYDPQTDTGRIDVHAWQLPIYNPGNGDLRTAAIVDASITSSAVAGLRFDGELTIHDIRIAGLPDDAPDFDVNTGEIVVKVVTDGTRSNLVLRGNIPELLNLDGALNLSASRIQGSATIALLYPELFSPYLAPYVSAPSGEMNAVISVDGEIQAPEITGVVNWNNGGLDVDILGLNLRELNARANSEDGARFVLVSTGKDGSGGDLRVDGELDAIFSDQRAIHLKLVTRGAGVLNRSDARAKVTSDIDYFYKSDSHRLEGDITVDEALFTIRELPRTVVTPSSDVTVKGRNQQAQNQPLDLDLGVTLTNKARVSAFGLDSSIAGKLRYQAKRGAPIKLVGTLATVDGSFSVYGQTLTIRRGKLVFDGPLDDPRVDVFASRDVKVDGRGYQVGVIVSGYASELNTQITSNPALPEVDALSLLLTGRLLRQTGQQEKQQIAGAALTMGLQKAGFITNRIMALTGIDDISFSQSGDGVEVGAGVQLNQNLYLRYTYGALSRIGGMLLDYNLSDSTRLRATTGDTQSIELQYIFGK